MNGLSFSNVVRSPSILLPEKQDAGSVTASIYHLIKKRAQEIYQARCAHPSLEDVLNFIYDMQEGKQLDFASKLYQAWGTDEAALGLTLRQYMEHCLWEVAKIEVLEEIEACVCGFDSEGDAMPV